MGGVSIWHWIVVGVIVMLLFGRGKISGMMGEVASGIKAFQKGLKDEDKPTPPPQQLDATATTVEARETDKSKDA